MPAVIDPNVCDRDFAGCFPARICPEQAFSYHAGQDQVIIISDLCGECPGPCMNFCDRYAIRYTSDDDEFAVLKAQTLGTLSDVEAAEELHRLKEEAKAEAAEQAQTAAVEVTTTTFDELVIRNTLPVVVDFWAPWCGPCKTMAPIFERLAKEFQGLVQFVKVNTEAEPVLATRFEVQSIPTLGFFWRGHMVNAYAGALPEAHLKAVVDQFLSLVQQQTVREKSAATPLDIE
ncbi:MAG TPA: thioredoxin [Nitrolancea sp.]|nr:thioredoxin [Nitrolancea sp.]